MKQQLTYAQRAQRHSNAAAAERAVALHFAALVLFLLYVARDPEIGTNPYYGIFTALWVFFLIGFVLFHIARAEVY
jgi:hypothetical protein